MDTFGYSTKLCCFSLWLYVYFIMQIHHDENKVGPIKLLSAINAWRINGLETVHASDAKIYKAGSSMNFISEISEGVSSQLHAGIMKTARRVLLDEIISNIISEYVTSKKAQKHLKLHQVNQAAKSCYSDGRMVIYTAFYFVRMSCIYNC